MSTSSHKMIDPIILCWKTHKLRTQNLPKKELCVMRNHCFFLLLLWYKFSYVSDLGIVMIKVQTIGSIKKYISIVQMHAVFL